jgi:hypothetical protein
MGQLEAARPYFERALAILVATIPDHPNTGFVRRNLERLEEELASEGG